jgi:hypothetical protein
VVLGITLSIVSADVLSINSGGDNGMIINPNYLLEGFFFQSNEEPIDPNPVLVSADGTNESHVDLECSFDVLDNDDDYLDVSVKWYKDSSEQLEMNYYNVSNGTTYTSTLDSGNLTLGDVWYCSVRAYDGNDYSNWVDSNTLEIIDITNPEVYIISPLSEDVYNYTTLDVDFNVSIIEDENMSMCFYDLDEEGNVSMNELNDSYFYSEPFLGPGFHDVVFWCNDTSNNWGTNSTTFYIEDEAAISIDLSDELSWWVRWNLTYLPVNDLGAIGNNNSGITEYYVNVSATATKVDLYVRADGDLMTIDEDVLGLGNETFSYVVNDPYVNTTSNMTMQTNYINVGTSLNDGDVVYLKFFIDAPSGQPAGVYQNQLDFKAVREGYSI